MLYPAAVVTVAPAQLSMALGRPFHFCFLTVLAERDVAYDDDDDDQGDDKNVIGARRASWRIVSSIEQKEESKGNEAQVAMIKGYREKIETELAKICEDILDVLDKHLIPSAASGESKVFYHKMYVIFFFFQFGDIVWMLTRFVCSGWVTTTVILRSSLLVTSARTAQTSL